MNDTTKKTTTNPAGTITNMIAPAGYWNLLDSLSDHRMDSPEYAAIQKEICELIGVPNEAPDPSGPAAPMLRELPTPDNGKTYATEANARRAAYRLKVSGHFQIVAVVFPDPYRRQRLDVVRYRVIVHPVNLELVAPLLSTGHQIVAL